MKTTIAKNERLMAIGLLAVAKQQNSALTETRDALCALMGEDPEDMGHCCDAVYSDYGIKYLLARLNITVADAQPEASK